jgi:TonB family protein
MKKVILCIFLFATVWAQTPASSAPSPRVTKFVAPAYPWKARKARIQGETKSEIQVRADGTVDAVNVTMAHPIFRDYVEAALKQWEFEPTGKTFAQKITVRFSLLDGCDDIRSSDPDVYRETRVQAQLPQLVEVKSCLEPIIVEQN